MKQSISLTARLSFLFAASSACVLLVAGLLFEHAGANQFLQRDTVELYGKMALIQKELQQTTTPQAVATLPIRLHDIVLGHPGIAVAVFSDQGNVLFSTGPQNVVQYLLRALEINSAHPTVWHSSDHVYRIMADRLQMGASSELSTNVEIGLDITNNQNFLSDFQDFLWFGMSLAMLAMGWLGWLVVHKGLAPLYAVSKAMESLSVQSLNTTIPTTNVPHELHILINSFNLMLIKLNESFNRLSEFSSDIAHELRTPIQNLMMQTQVILSHPRDIDDYRNALMSNMEEFERLSRMISDMLFLAKADNKQVVPKKEPIQLHDEVTHLFSFYEALASERQVQLRQSGCATVFADRLMLQRAFSNLLSNALRFTPEGMIIEIVIENNVNGISVSVTNQGPEIPTEHLPHVFERLYRVDAARREGNIENVGLGLAITKSIINMHGGTIAVTSANGLTCFKFILPQP